MTYELLLIIRDICGLTYIMGSFNLFVFTVCCFHFFSLYWHKDIFLIYNFLCQALLEIINIDACCLLWNTTRTSISICSWLTCFFKRKLVFIKSMLKFWVLNSYRLSSNICVWVCLATALLVSLIHWAPVLYYCPMSRIFTEILVSTMPLVPYSEQDCNFYIWMNTSVLFGM